MGTVDMVVAVATLVTVAVLVVDAFKPMLEAGGTAQNAVKAVAGGGAAYLSARMLF